MESLGVIGMAVLVAICAAVGAKLVLLASRTRRIPELAMGAGYLLFGALGYPLAAAARAGISDSPEVAGALLAWALLVQNLGVLACYVFVWQVFRRGASGGLALAVAGLALGASWIGHAFDPGYAGARSGGPWYYTGLAVRAAAFVWASVEAYAYYARLRRRLRLGLADPVVANRVLLWGLSSSWIAFGFAVFFVGQRSAGATATPVVLLTALCGLGGGTAIWLAFFPTAAYERWLRAGQPAVAEPGSGAEDAWPR
jgi:hypothetical protein